MPLAVACVLSACAGRTPAPVAVVQPQDRYMDCGAITSEVQANNKRISELGSEEGKKVAQNVIVGTAGLFIPILWFGMDFQNAAGKEVAALQSRQQYLATIAEQRCGAYAPLPVQSIPPATVGAPTSAPGQPAVLAAPTTPVPAAPMPETPAAAPAPQPVSISNPPSAPTERECVQTDGSRLRLAANSCPPGTTPAS
jgi:hypothetical protein